MIRKHHKPLATIIIALFLASNVTAIWGAIGDNIVSGVATLTPGGILLSSGGDPPQIKSLGVAANGEIPIGDGSTDPQLAVITGDASQVIVTNSAGGIALSTPQDIHTGATPTFSGMTLNGTLDMNGNRADNLSDLNFISATELTISSGAVTATIGHHAIDTESDAADDDLDTINGGEGGDILLILPANDSRTVRLRNGVGNIFLKHKVGGSSYSFTAPAGSSGIFYVAGNYFAPSGEAVLTQASLTQTLGTANISYAAHAFVVAKGDGATDGSDLVLTVTGTSVDDEGNRTAADSQVVVADALLATFATDTYMETSKKWIGQITYTLSSTGGGTFNVSFNYGFAKYEDFGNVDFTINYFECVGLAGANDSGFNVRLFHHNTADWHYSAAAFVPGPQAGDTSELANMNTTHNTEIDLRNGEPFNYKRTDLDTDVDGENGEGIVIEITTSANKALEDMDIHVQGHFTPKNAFMSSTKQHLIFMKHGSNWLEL